MNGLSRWSFFVALCAGWFVTASSRAATFTWNTPAAGNWTDGTRWTPVGVPGQSSATDMAVVGSGAGFGGTAILNSAAPSVVNFNIGSLGEGTLNVVPGGSLTTTGTGDAIGLNGTGRLVMSGGTLTLGGRLEIDQGEITQSGGTISLANSQLGDLNLGIENTGRWSVSGTGHLIVGDLLNVGTEGTGIFTQAGGQVEVRNILNVGVVEGQGEYSFNGGILSVENALRVGSSGDATLRIGSTQGSIVLGALHMFPRGTLALALGATTPAVEADRATLAGQLTVSLSQNLAANAVRPVVIVQGDAATTTTFAGLPQGAVLHARGPSAGGKTPLRVNYAANVDGGLVGNDVTLTVLSVGDANFDRVVNRADLVKLLDGYGGSGDWTEGDFDGDGVVGLSDLLLWRSSAAESPTAELSPAPAYPSIPPGNSTAASPVPEPSSVVLAGIGTIVALARRRRKR